MANDAKRNCQVVVVYDDGATAIWAISVEQADRISNDLEKDLGQPDTIHC